MTLGMFVDIQDKQCRKRYPKLKVKAAEAQACNKVFLRMWLQKMDETNRVHIWVRVALQSSVTMDELLKANDSSWHVPPEAYRNLCDAANKYCICVVALENHFQIISNALKIANCFKVVHSNNIGYCTQYN